MPELPEVEVSRQGILPHLLGRRVIRVCIRQPRLRWPIPAEVHRLEGQEILAIERRAKYLLIRVADGCAILHLGMSGSLRVIDAELPPGKHDHVDLLLDSDKALRLNDPRRFGAFLWQEPDETHHLLAHLGPEPLSDAFTAQYLYQASRGRKTPVKSFLMDNKVVVGVGNIYANEALFEAGVHPKRGAGAISQQRYETLTAAIKQILARAIQQGGTTLKDFTRVDGKPGYFVQQLQVYGRAGKPCPNCLQPITSIRLGQRNTFYCSHCQH